MEPVLLLISFILIVIVKTQMVMLCLTAHREAVVEHRVGKEVKIKIGKTRIKTQDIIIRFKFRILFQKNRLNVIQQQILKTIIVKLSHLNSTELDTNTIMGKVISCLQ